MKEIKGDLIKLALDGEFDVIAHGCNCFCNMGSGIARTIKQHFPDAFKVDKNTKVGDKKKLGKCTMVQQHGVWVVNAYTQYSYGSGINVNYNAIRKCMQFINLEFKNKRVGLPLIGCGLAKGDWKTVKQIILDELTDVDVTVVHYG